MKYKVMDIYGNIFEYNSEKKEDALDNFCAENSLDNLWGIVV